MIAHAKTVMCFDYLKTYQVSDAIHRLVHDPLNVIFRLHIPPTASFIHGTFCHLGNFSCHAESTCYCLVWTLVRIPRS